MQEKTNITGLFRDTETGALINKDKSGLASYKQKKQQMSKLSFLENQVKTLTQELQNVRAILDRNDIK